MREIIFGVCRFFKKVVLAGREAHSTLAQIHEWSVAAGHWCETRIGGFEAIEEQRLHVEAEATGRRVVRAMRRMLEKNRRARLFLFR